VAPGPPWRPSGLPGLHVYPLTGGPGVGGAICLLVSLAPGHGLPSHRHQGEEGTLVLQGWGQEAEGHCWGPGDRLHRAAGSVHAFTALATTPCLGAVVSDGGIEFVAAHPAMGT
jgi:anti-sigma factor ChrR (cupin superfamily)